jgi:hypothetical protein
MAWRDTIYVQFPDKATAQALATNLGVDFPEDGDIPNGNNNYAMHAPMQAPWITPPVYDLNDGTLLSSGVPEPGYWAMLRFNDSFVGYADIIAAINAAGIQRTLINPPVVWA